MKTEEKILQHVPVQIEGVSDDVRDTCFTEGVNKALEVSADFFCDTWPRENKEELMDRLKNRKELKP